MTERSRGAGFEAGLHVTREQGQAILVAPSSAYQAVSPSRPGTCRVRSGCSPRFRAELTIHLPCIGAEVVAYAAALLAEAEAEPTRAYELLLRFWDLDAERDNRTSIGTWHQHSSASRWRSKNPT